MDVNRPSFELHIEELVLHGFAPGDRAVIGAAMQQELGRLFAEQGVPRSLSQANDFARMPGGTVSIAPGMRPAAIGAQIAQSLYGGLQPSHAPSPGSAPAGGMMR
jgi:hypothetical protein